MSETRLRPALKGKELVLAIIRWILIIFFAVYTLFPLIWLIISSLKTNFEFLAQSPFSLPAKPQWVNYFNALAVAGLGRMLLNSVFVGLLATLLNVVIASMSAYCISRFRFRGRERIFTLFTAGILVPLNALMVPYFVIINKLGLYNTYGGMILLYCAIGIPMSTFLIRGLMASIPMEVEEAAYIDGGGVFGRFFRLFGEAAYHPGRYPVFYQPVLDGLRLHVCSHCDLDCSVHTWVYSLPGADHCRYDKRRRQRIKSLLI